jgi:hypothetical protein
MTMTSLISACQVLDDVKSGKALHGYVARREFDSDVSIDNTMI